MTKTQLISALSEKSTLDKKEVASVLVALEEVIAEQLSGVGVITPLPGLFKITTVLKPAKDAQYGVPNPFKPGELMDVSAKPAKNVVRVRAMKKLKEMVGLPDTTS
jgi:nucleoid DNA-binding protein